MLSDSANPTKLSQWTLPGVVFLALSAVHLVSQLLNNSAWSSATQVLLMSCLAVVVFTASSTPRSREVSLLLLALFFSWLGDTLPRFGFENGFLIMVGFFLLAQVVYVWLFWPHRARSIVATNRWLLLPYLAWFALLIVLCVPKAGTLLVPIVIYGVTLLLMAILATSFGPLATLGGALFFFSDSLIAFRSIAGIEFPLHSFLIMLTYIAAQVLLSYAIMTRNKQRLSGL